MTTLFTVGEDAGHHVGDIGCPRCLDQYPVPCQCGGLMHGVPGEEEDADGNTLLVTCCDQCGRSEDLQEV